MFDGFPSLPSFKIALKIRKKIWHLQRKKGPQPSRRRKMVAFLREEGGLTFEEIGKRVGVSRAGAWMLWDRNVKSRKGDTPTHATK